MTKFHPYFKEIRADASAASNQGRTWRVPDLCAAYDWPKNLVGGGTIAIVSLGGGWTMADMAAHFASLQQPLPQIVDVSVDGTNNAPGSDEDIEVTLDIQIAGASYHAATGRPATIRVYWARDIAPAVRAAIKDGCDVCSISWGASEITWGTVAARDMEQAAGEATAAGMTVLAAAGDNDSSDGAPTPANVDLPAACPHVLGCGGTSKTRTSEVVWNDAPGNPSGSGTGGGYSILFPMPTWQLAGRAPRGPGRMVPDVAAVADPRTGYEIHYGGLPRIVGGTSAVAPLYAGLLAATGRKRGFISEKLWRSLDNFGDVTQGNNGLYHAQVGPDPCTGLGVPVGSKLAALLKDHTVVPVQSVATIHLSEVIEWAMTLLPHGPINLTMAQHFIEAGLRAHWPEGMTAVQLHEAIDWAASALPHATLMRHTTRHFIARSLEQRWPNGLPR